MPRAMPLLGYPSFGVACTALSELGLSNPEIAERINAARPNEKPIKASRVWQAIHTNGGALSRRVTFSDCNFESLNAAAKARGCSVEQLIKRLVSVVARDDLIDAILDDGVADG